MKKILCFLLVALIPVFFCWSAGQQDNPRSLTVYCYDSFSSEWGPGIEIAQKFTEKTGIPIEFSSPGDAITVLNKLILEGDDTPADIVIGLDNSLLPRVMEADLLSSYKPDRISEIPEELIFDPDYYLVPFDYGHIAINYNSNVLKNPPSSLEDLTQQRFRDSLILSDPRTSTPGLAFLLWTISVYGDQWPEYWNRLKPSILTITDGWSAAYALYTANEAPLVLSYGTSPVYHVEYEQDSTFRAAEFTDGHPVQIEGMGIVKTSTNREASEMFIDFMLEPEIQTILAKSNIMLPVTELTTLPESFTNALVPKKTLQIWTSDTKSTNFGLSSEETRELINQWLKVFSE